MSKFKGFGDSPQDNAEMEGVHVTQLPCPQRDVTGCQGRLTEPYIISDEPQFAIACTDCQWWTLT